MCGCVCIMCVYVYCVCVSRCLDVHICICIYIYICILSVQGQWPGILAQAGGQPCARSPGNLPCPTLFPFKYRFFSNQKLIFRLYITYPADPIQDFCSVVGSKISQNMFTHVSVKCTNSKYFVAFRY